MVFLNLRKKERRRDKTHLKSQINPSKTPSNMTSNRQGSDKRTGPLANTLVNDLFKSLNVKRPVGMRKTAATQSIGFTPTKATITYYSPPATWGSEDPDRIAALASMIRWPVTNPYFQTSDHATWIYSCLDIAFPGVSQTVLAKDPHVVANRTELTRELIESKRVGNEPMPDLPGLLIDEVCDSAEWLHAIGALTTLIFTLGKSPNENNFSAFTVNRPQAIAGKMGIAIDSSSPMAGARLPLLAHFMAFAGYFNMRYKQRKTLVRLLLLWSGLEDLTEDQNVVVTQIALWKEAGMTHMKMVRDFLINFGEVIILIDGIKDEVLTFMDAWDEYENSNDPEKDYLRVIDGDRAQLGRSRDYINLLNLARSLAAAVDPRFKQYASGLGESPHKNTFIEKCKVKEYSLPEKYLSDTLESQTGGGNVRLV